MLFSYLYFLITLKEHASFEKHIKLELARPDQNEKIAYKCLFQDKQINNIISQISFQFLIT